MEKEKRLTHRGKYLQSRCCLIPLPLPLLLLLLLLLRPLLVLIHFLSHSLIIDVRSAYLIGTFKLFCLFLFFVYWIEFFQLIFFLLIFMFSSSSFLHAAVLEEILDIRLQ